MNRLQAGTPLGDAEFQELRHRAIFECCKWDPQNDAGDVLASFPLLLTANAWRTISSAAERLATETLEAEEALLRNPSLWTRLGLSPALRDALREAPRSPRGVRLMRFDFHPVPGGWAISEGNTDVPGGLVEASGVAGLMQRSFPEVRPSGDPAAAYCDALVQFDPTGPVALVHATAYSDDAQVMRFLQSRLEARGVRAELIAPDHLRWSAGRPVSILGGRSSAMTSVVRFFPAEWLPRLDAISGWPNLFGADVPLSNPATAVLTQSKRFPLAWDELGTSLETWRSVLPETLPFRGDVEEGWVLKPALSRMGEGIVMPGVTPPAVAAVTLKAARRRPEAWIIQRRFETLPVETPLGRMYPTLGVYTVGTKAAGCYGRVARSPVIDGAAIDVPVFIAGESP